MWHVQPRLSGSLGSAREIIGLGDLRGLFLNDSVVSQTLGLALLTSRLLALILLEAEACASFPQAIQGREVMHLFNHRD